MSRKYRHISEYETEIISMVNQGLKLSVLVYESRIFTVQLHLLVLLLLQKSVVNSFYACFQKSYLLSDNQLPISIICIPSY